MDTHVVTVATRPQTPATIIAARPSLEPVPEGAVTLVENDMAMFGRDACSVKGQPAAARLEYAIAWEMIEDSEGNSVLNLKL